MIRNVSNGTELLAQAAAATAGDTLRLSAGTFAVGNSPVVLPDGVHMQGAGRTLSTISSQATFSEGPCVKPGSGSIISDLSITGTLDFLNFQAPIGFLTPLQTPFTTASIYRCNLSAYSDGIYLKGAAVPPAMQLSLYDCNFSTGYDNTRIICLGASWDCVLDLYNCTCESLNPTGIGNDNRCHSISIGTLRIFKGLNRAIVGATGTGYAACLHVDAAVARIEAYGTVLESSNAGSGATRDAYREGAGTIIINKDSTYNSGKFTGTVTVRGGEWPVKLTTAVHGRLRG
jgi:hypothetical protein